MRVDLTVFSMEWRVRQAKPRFQSLTDFQAAVTRQCPRLGNPLMHIRWVNCTALPKEGGKDRNLNEIARIC